MTFNDCKIITSLPFIRYEKVLCESRRLAFELANKDIHDPGAIAYKAEVISYQELEFFCVYTELSHQFLLSLAGAPLSINSEDLTLKSEKLTLETIAGFYDCEALEAKSWLDDITRRALDYYVFGSHGYKPRCQPSSKRFP